VERFIQTLKREWAYAYSWPNSAERTRTLASYLRYYNGRRSSQLSGRPAADQSCSQRLWIGQLSAPDPKASPSFAPSRGRSSVEMLTAKRASRSSETSTVSRRILTS
jgi:hypothetical protein